MQYCVVCLCFSVVVLNTSCIILHQTLKKNMKELSIHPSIHPSINQGMKKSYDLSICGHDQQEIGKDPSYIYIYIYMYLHDNSFIYLYK